MGWFGKKAKRHPKRKKKKKKKKNNNNLCTTRPALLVKRARKATCGIFKILGLFARLHRFYRKKLPAVR